MRDWDGRLIYEEAFFESQAKRYRGDPENYLVMLARSCTRILDGQGGIGPYVFFCTPGSHGSYVFHAEEQIV